MRIRSLLPALSILALCLLGGCSDREFQRQAQGTPERVAGKYAYRWRSGELEVLILNQAGEYQHILYPAGADPEAQPPRHSSRGRWTTKPGGRWMPNEIHFTDYYDLNGLNQFAHPAPNPLLFSTEQMWWEAGPTHDIRYSWDFDYVFKRTPAAPTPVAKDR